MEFSYSSLIMEPLEITELETLAVSNNESGRSYGACIDWPVIMEKIRCSFVVDQIHICIVIALEISDRCKISAVGYTTYIQLTVSAAGIDHVCKGIKRGDLFCLMDEADEKLLAHYVGIHENVAVLCIAVVVLNGENTLLTVQVQDVAVQIVLLGIINGMIKHGHILHRIRYGYRLSLE